jgi:biopolymer transport protein ExbD
MRRRPFRKSDREPTITLINVVFLMLIFFLVAGTIGPSVDPRLTLVQADGLIATPPSDALLVLADGTLLRRGQVVTVVQAAKGSGTIRVMPDRDLPAQALVALGRDLKAAGAQAVIIVAERRSP